MTETPLAWKRQGIDDRKFCRSTMPLLKGPALGTNDAIAGAGRSLRRVEIVLGRMQHRGNGAKTCVELIHGRSRQG
jgi:hypothetical protein